MSALLHACCVDVADRSTHNSVTKDVLEVKTLLLQLRRLLQEVGT